LDFVASLVAEVGTTGDKLKVLKWAFEANAGDPIEVFGGTEETSLARLRRRGFSEQMIDRFWRPWLSGIFLESELTTSSRMLEFVFEMFARGGAAVPRRGMQAIPEQMAAGLAPGQIKLNTSVRRLDRGHVWDSDENLYAADHIVLAVDGGTAARLAGVSTEMTWRSAQAFYFAAESFPIVDPLLMLNGAGDGVINHLAVMSAVNPHCAPAGQELVMVGIRPGVDETAAELEQLARTQLHDWFGSATAKWRLLRHSLIAEALPAKSSLTAPMVRPLAMGLWNCGDYTSTPSIQGAMESGRMVAEAILEWR
jgi:phytoene dehydrogenase-like protein